MGRKLSHKEYCELVRQNYGDKFSIISQYQGANKKITVKHNKCGYTFDVLASKLSAKTGNVLCSCEYARRFDPKINSIFAIDKDFAKLFVHKEDTIKYSVHSIESAEFECPKCGKIISKRIADVYRRGLSCSYCSDNIPFAERIMYSFLNMQKNYLDEKSFDFHKTFDWSKRKEYDFYFEVNSIPYIIEMNGEQHYIERKNSKICVDLKFQQNNDEYKRSLALENCISYLNYIQIDCRKSDYTFIKNNIINSRLNEIFSLDDFDWNSCLQSTCTSLLVKVCTLWNEGVHCASAIKKETRLSDTAVYKFLCRGRDIGLCDYENMVKTKVRCINENLIFDSITEAGKHYNIKSNNISAVCRGLRKYCGIHPTTHEKLQWEYVRGVA